jgi:hypothetical protein
VKCHRALGDLDRFVEHRQNRSERSIRSSMDEHERFTRFDALADFFDLRTSHREINCVIGPSPAAAE